MLNYVPLFKRNVSIHYKSLLHAFVVTTFHSPWFTKSTTYPTRSRFMMPFWIAWNKPNRWLVQHTHTVVVRRRCSVWLTKPFSFFYILMREITLCHTLPSRVFIHYIFKPGLKPGLLFGWFLCLFDIFRRPTLWYFGESSFGCSAGRTTIVIR